jgi:dCMP deaminase
MTFFLTFLCVHHIHKMFLKSDTFSKEHHTWSTRNEVHGEQNAILYSARKNSAATEGADMYTVYSPCINCAKVIAAAGIERVFYHDLYKRDTGGIDFLTKHGIQCERVDVSGVAV